MRPKSFIGRSVDKSWGMLSSMPTLTRRRSVGALVQILGKPRGPLGSELVPFRSQTEVLRHVLVPEHLNLCKNFIADIFSEFEYFKRYQFVLKNNDSWWSKCQIGNKPEEKMQISPFATDQLAYQHLGRGGSKKYDTIWEFFPNTNKPGTNNTNQPGNNTNQSGTNNRNQQYQ